MKFKFSVAGSVLLSVVLSLSAFAQNTETDGASSSQAIKVKRATSGSLDQAVYTFQDRSLAAYSSVMENGSSELDDWNAINNSPTVADIENFLEMYSSGQFVDDAELLLIAARKGELNSELATSEASDEQEGQSITFAAPLNSDVPHISGKSISELIKGSPRHSPVEGLPESYWKEQECSGCHEWNKERLCVQAQFYTTDAGALRMAKKHPLGGGFKSLLREWAVQGCN